MTELLSTQCRSSSYEPSSSPLSRPPPPPFRPPSPPSPPSPSTSPSPAPSFSSRAVLSYKLTISSCMCFIPHPTMPKLSHVFVSHAPPEPEKVPLLRSGDSIPVPCRSASGLCGEQGASSRGRENPKQLPWRSLLSAIKRPGGTHTVRCSPVQSGAVQCSAAQCSAV